MKLETITSLGKIARKIDLCSDELRRISYQNDITAKEDVKIMEISDELSQLFIRIIEVKNGSKTG